MIEHELAQCHVINHQGRAPGPQHKPSQKTTPDGREQGKIAVPKQHKKYRKKDLQSKLMEETNALRKANAGSLLGHLVFDERDGGEDDFANIPPLKDASDHDMSSPRQGLFTPNSDRVRVSKSGMVRNSPAVMQAKGSESQLVVDPVSTLIDGHHVEVSSTLVVSSLSCHTSSQKVISLGDAKAPVTTPIDGHHVATVVVISSSRHTSSQKDKSLEDVKALLPDNDTLVLQNHFSSLEGLETTDAGGVHRIVRQLF